MLSRMLVVMRRMARQPCTNLTESSHGAKVHRLFANGVLQSLSISSLHRTCFCCMTSVLSNSVPRPLFEAPVHLRPLSICQMHMPHITKPGAAQAVRLSIIQREDLTQALCNSLNI